MKTKLVCPWNLKVGQKLIQIDLDGARRANKILSIKKTQGWFTGRSLWCVVTDDYLFPFTNFFHAASRSGALKLQKAEILVD